MGSSKELFLSEHEPTKKVMKQERMGIKRSRYINVQEKSNFLLTWLGKLHSNMHSHFDNYLLPTSITKKKLVELTTR